MFGMFEIVVCMLLCILDGWKILLIFLLLLSRLISICVCVCVVCAILIRIQHGTSRSYDSEDENMTRKHSRFGSSQHLRSSIYSRTDIQEQVRATTCDDALVCFEFHFPVRLSRRKLYVSHLNDFSLCGFPWNCTLFYWIVNVCPLLNNTHHFPMHLRAIVPLSQQMPPVLLIGTTTEPRETLQTWRILRLRVQPHEQPEFFRLLCGQRFVRREYRHIGSVSSRARVSWMRFFRCRVRLVSGVWVEFCLRRTSFRRPPMPSENILLTCFSHVEIW